MGGDVVAAGATGDALEAMVARLGVERGTQLVHGTIAAADLSARKAEAMQFVPHPPGGLAH